MTHIAKFIAESINDYRSKSGHAPTRISLSRDLAWWIIDEIPYYAKPNKPHKPEDFIGGKIFGITVDLLPKEAQGQILIHSGTYYTYKTGQVQP